MSFSLGGEGEERRRKRRRGGEGDGGESGGFSRVVLEYIAADSTSLKPVKHRESMAAAKKTHK